VEIRLLSYFQPNISRLWRGETPGSGIYAAAGFRETFQRGLFVGKFGENLIELSYLQNFFDLRRESNYFHCAAFFDYRQVVANEFTDSGTVQIIESLQIQNYVVFTVTKQALNRIAKRLTFERSEAPADIHERNFVGLPDLNSEIQSWVLVRKRTRFYIESRGRQEAGAVLNWNLGH
jgi:hypothetical protein